MWQYTTLIELLSVSKITLFCLLDRLQGCDWMASWPKSTRIFFVQSFLLLSTGLSKKNGAHINRYEVFTQSKHVLSYEQTQSVHSLHFSKKTITGHVYLDILTEWLMPQVEDDMPDVVFQQDSASSRFQLGVRANFNDIFLGYCISLVAEEFITANLASVFTEFDTIWLFHVGIQQRLNLCSSLPQNLKCPRQFSPHHWSR